MLMRRIACASRFADTGKGRYYMEGKIFDTHAHYDDRRFDQDRREVLEMIGREGVGLVTNIGSSMEANRATLSLAEEYDFIYAAIGVHPSDTAELTEEDMGWLEESATRDKVVAIGEIGLDYHYDEPEKDWQKRWFRRQLELAAKVKLPVCIHSREAARDTLDIMREMHAEDMGGVIHCFSYGWDMAKIYLDMGFYLGIGGVVTFKNGKKLKEVVGKAPMERLVMETDAPYLTPEPDRGKRNDSHYLWAVAEEIGRLKGMNREEVARITWENGKRMYGLS